MSRRVVVTGLGAITPIGNSVPEFWEGIKERADKSSYEGLENIIKAIETAKARLQANVNFDLTMELLFLTIREN